MLNKLAFSPVRRDLKIAVTISAIGTTISVLGLKFESLKLATIGFFILIITLFATRHPIPLVGLGIGLVLIYPSPDPSDLAARDVHSPVLFASRLTDGSWPFSPDLLYSWGFPDTPGLHIHLAIIHHLTNLPLQPQYENVVLAPFLVGLLYVVVTLLSVYALARRYSVAPTSLAMAPVLLWIPLYELKTAFRRQSFGIALFASLLLYVAVVARQPRNKWTRPVSYLIPISLVIGHHFSALLSLIAIGTYRSRLKGHLTRLAIVTGLFFSVWFVLSGYTSFLVIAAVRILSPEGVVTSDTFSYGLIYILRAHAFKWTYIFILSIPSLALIIHTAVKSDRNHYINRIAIFVIILGIIAPLSWFSGILSPYRLMTFYIIAGGWLALDGPYRIVRRIRSVYGLQVIVGVLVIISAVTVPLYLVSGGTPDRDNAELGYRYHDSVYKVAEYSKALPSDWVVVGDKKVMETIVPTTQRGVITAPANIQNGSIPQNAALLYASRNAKIYKGLAPGAGSSTVKYRLRDVVYQFERENRIYDSRTYRVYIAGDNR